MKNRILSLILLFVFILGLTGGGQAQTPSTDDETALIYVEIGGPADLERFEATGLPAYLHLQGRQPQNYLLSGADAAGLVLLERAGLRYSILDADMAGTGYYLAYAMLGRQIEWDAFGRVMLDDGVQVLLRASAVEAAELAQAGAELQAVTFDPKPLHPTSPAINIPTDIDPDPLIQTMIDLVDSSTVDDYTAGLTGDQQVWVDGDWYTITSRYTYSGEPIQKATHWTGEHFSDLGLDVEYHVWGGATYPNVIAELPGLVNPEDIFIIGGHLDDVQGTPGADDNGSGSVAAMIAADILTQYQWGCTLRFALWTGEEQGLNGSAAYAQRSSQLGENILGYLNLDMISYNTVSSPPGIDLIYNPNMPPTQDLAQLFADVVSAYGLNLIPELRTSLSGGSDHSSFWNYGYTAILGIEDQSDFNPYYHGPGDTREHQDLPYYTEFVKASLGTFAHMTECLIPSGIGSLDGTVTADNGGAPIEGAQVVAENSAGNSFDVLTDASGYYTRTLLADTYTVTASAYGYLPSSVTGVEVVTDTVTTQDFALLDAPTYTVSGTVTEAGSGIPLLAQVIFEGSPVSTMTDPATGYYSATLPEGAYIMHVSADLHEPEERAVVVDHDQTQDFALNTLPCILLVDDDNNAPDVLPWYTAALDSLGYDYNVSADDSPELSDLLGYEMVMWFSGDRYGGSAGPGDTDETNLAAYLDDGGRLFLSSQDYLYDFELTPFGQNYLGIGSYSDDTGNASTKYGLTGDPIGDGLGPYPLAYPANFSDYGDIVNAGTGASVAFRSSSGGGNNLDVDKDGGDWRTVFFGTSWVPVANASASNGEELLGRIVNWFGGCEGYSVDLSGDQSMSGIPTETITYTLTLTNTSSSMTDTFDLSLGESAFPTMADVSVIGPLVPGASADFHVAVEIPESALPDETDAVQVTATSQGDDSRSDTATLTTTVGGSYGVMMNSPQTEGAGEAGSTLTYTVQMTNTGSLQDTLVLTYASVDPGWEVLLAQDSFELAGGESAATSFQVVIPVGAAAGDGDSFTLQAISWHDPSKWNEIEFTTTVSGACTSPSGVDFLWSPSVPWAGDEMTFVASAAGSTPMTYSWYFGDGESAQGEQVLHFYESRGVYTVTLIAGNACGEASISQGVTVAPLMQLYLPVISQAGP